MRSHRQIFSTMCRNRHRTLSPNPPMQCSKEDRLRAYLPMISSGGNHARRKKLKDSNNFQRLLCDDEVPSFDIIWQMHTFVHSHEWPKHVRHGWSEKRHLCHCGNWKREKLGHQKLKLNLLAQFVKLLTASIWSTPWLLTFRWLPLPIIVRFLRIPKSTEWCETQS